jgi:hypothetical protein
MKGKAMNQQHVRNIFVAIMLLVAGGSMTADPVLAQGGAAPPAEKIVVRFTWKLYGVYAPLYVALDKGYFAPRDAQCADDGENGSGGARDPGPRNFGRDHGA